MLIAGAGGHAIEVLDILLENIPRDRIAFFDDVTNVRSVHNFFPVLKNDSEVIDWFAKGNEFCIGVGSVLFRKSIYNKLKSLGGNLMGFRSGSAEISDFSSIDKGADICKQVFVSSLTEIGLGTLINTGAKIHHNVRLGSFCEISPGVTLLGGSSVGDECSIGSGAIVLPKIRICNNTVVGAGTIVTKDIIEAGTYVGNPVKKIK